MFATIVVTACIDPVAYGAVPGDGKPDNAAIQTAIDHAIEFHDDVCLGEGIWELGPPARTGGKHGPIGSLVIHGGPITIRGLGTKSRLRLVGDGDKHDWRGIEVTGAHNVTLADFAIDGLGAFDTEEQTHLVEIGPASKDITITGIEFGPMRRPDQHVGDGIGGDGLRLLGNPGSEVEDVMITDSTFIDCDRSGIGLQRSLRRIAILRDTITGAGDQSIDFEPTGRGVVEDVTMVDLHIVKPPESQGAWAMTIVGTGADLARQITLLNSHIEGGAIMLMNVHGVLLRGNTIVQGAQTRDPTISLIRRGSDLRIERNHIVRPATAQPGMLVRASDNNGQVPHGVTIVDNDLIQDTSAPVIGSVSVGGFTVHHNKITYNGGPGIAIVSANATEDDLRGVDVSDNEISGKSAALLDIAARTHHVHDVAVRGNRAPNVTNAMQCRGAGTSFERIRIDAGATASPACTNKSR